MSNNKTIEKTLSKRLKQFRIKSKWSTAEIAKYLEIEEKEYVDLERNGKVKAKQITNLSNLYMVDEYDFFTTNKVAIMTRMVDSDDMENIASFYKIVKNYNKIRRILEEK